MANDDFAVPGPGAWELDANHFPRPVPHVFAELFPTAMRAGLQPTTRRYGLVLDFVEFGFSKGFAYIKARPVAAPAGATRPPPRFIFKALLALHPELRRRLAFAADVFERKPWRADVERWDLEVKPAAVRAHTEVGAVNPAGLDRAGQRAHLERAYAHMAAMISQHHAFDVAAFLPVGDFLLHAAEWTGLSHSDVLQTLRGAAPVSAGESAELTRLVAALRGDRAARARLESGDAPASIVEALQTLAGEAGPAMRAWLALVGARLVEGLDPGSRTLAESPELIVKGLRGQLQRTGSASASDGAALARVRDRVPAAHRPAFDALLAEARHVSRLRDERALYSDVWATGLFRRAALALGRTLVAEGRLEAPEHLLYASWSELLATADGSGCSAPELAARCKDITSRTLADAPARLGPPDGGPPPRAWLPAQAARSLYAILTFVDGMSKDAVAGATSEPAAARGLAVSAGQYEGVARLVRGAADFGRIERGDVLVTGSTSPSFNVVLPVLGAIVTDRGGLLSHAALVAREYGIPAVVGCRDATRRLPDGARVRVDGTRGEARVVP